jgi:signal peptidase I
MNRSLLRRAGPELLGLAVMMLALTSARSSLADHYHVPTGSMEPTVLPGDQVLVAKAAYELRVPFTDVPLLDFGAPRVGDVVVLDSPQEDVVLLKRVVAVGGERVEVKRGRILRDGVLAPVHGSVEGLREVLAGTDHAVRLEGGGGPALGPVTVPAGQVLVVGDNRGNSLDGRSFGFVDEAAVRGRVLGVYLRHRRPTWQPL